MPNIDRLAELYYAPRDPQFDNADYDDKCVCEKCGMEVWLEDGKEINGRFYCNDCIDMYGIREEEDEDE